MNLETALHSTLLDCGPPVVIGLTTTSAAFFCLVFADYQALRQFGLLTSSGLLVTLWICLILFPVMVKLLGSDSHKGIRLSRVHGLFASIFSYLLSRPVKSICIALVLFAFSLFHMQKFSFDMDLFSGLPDDLESMRIDESISETFGVSHLLATQLTLESEDYRSALKAQELLDRELSILVKENAVSGFQSPSQYLAYSDVTDNINVTWQSNSKRLKGHKDLFLKLLSDLKFTPNPWYGEYYELMERVLDLKNESVDIRILAVRSHPVFKKFFALDDKKLILQTYIWPVHDFSDYTVIKDIAARFSDLSMPEEVSLHTTGTYQMFTHISSVVRSDFFRVSLISSIAVILFVLIFYRNSMLVCICVAPVAVAIPLTLALFVLAKVSFTPMSVTYIAIIVGIGIDDAVHIISRARNRSTAEFRAILPEIGILITLTTLSTVIGFGSMMISSFYTIFSSGLVISLGVFFCLVFTILVVPAGCILLQRKLNN